MAGKFELNKGKTGKFSFNLKAGNGQIVFTSQSYDTKRAASAGINSVRKNSQKEDRFERKASSKKQPYFVITAANGQVIGRSQMYANPVSMEKGIKSVVTNAPSAALVDLTAETEKKADTGKKAPASKAAAKKTSTTKKAAPKKAASGKTAPKKAAAKKAEAVAESADAAVDKAKSKAKAASGKVKSKAKAASKKAKTKAKKVTAKAKAKVKKAT